MTESDTASRGAPTILIIEDDDVTATDLQNGLTSAGYVVRRAGTANEALVTLRSTRADLILMSLMLPDTDGLILCSTLKAQIPTPIIVLGAGASEVDRALALESGAIDLLSTPVAFGTLLTQVRAVVRSHGLAAGAPSEGSLR